MTDSVERQARNLAHLYLRRDGQCVDHADRMAERVRTAAHLQSGVPPSRLVAAAQLADLGTSPDLDRLGFAPLDGALFLSSLGWPEDIVRLVAHFPVSALCAKQFGVEHLLAVIEPVPGLPGEILLWADITSSPLPGWAAVEQRVSRAIADATGTAMPQRVRERMQARIARAVTHVERALADPRRSGRRYEGRPETSGGVELRRAGAEADRD